METPLEAQDSGTYLFVKAGTPRNRRLAPKPSEEPLSIPKLDTGVLGLTAASDRPRLRYRRVPVEHSAWDRRLALAFAPDSPQADAYRALAAQLEGLVWFSAPIAGAGRTTTAANVALALAPTRRVTLVDADLWQPGIAQTFGLPPTRGLGALLRERRRDPHAPIDLTLVTESLAVLPAGDALNARNAERLFAMTELDALLEALQSTADIVLVDAPPITPMTAPCLADRAGAKVLVAPPAGWDDGSLQAAFNALGDPAARVVLNRTPP